MQFQVPQIDAEDKIVGPLTLRQFLYLTAGVGVSFLFYFVAEIMVFAVMTVLSMSVAGAFALIKINGRTLTQVMRSAIKFYWHPQVYVWQPDRKSLQIGASPELAAPAGGEALSREKVVAGNALKNAWRYLQTGSRAPAEKPVDDLQIQGKEVYQAFREMAGDRRVARRIDYSQ